MVAALPVYHLLSGNNSAEPWIANIVWTPIAGFPITTAFQLGAQPGPLMLFPLVWGFIGVPLFAGWAVRRVFRVLLSSESPSTRRRCQVVIALFVLSLFLNLPIPVTPFFGAMGFAWTAQ
jgi:hypothetical protein